MGYSNNKWRKILTILMIINLFFILFARFTRVFGATSDFDNFFNNNYPLTTDEFQFQSGLNNQYTIILPNWSYQYFPNIFICFNDDGHTRTGGIWLSQGKIFVQTQPNNSTSLTIRGEQGKYLYFHTLPIVSGSYSIDMSNLSYNDFTISNNGTTTYGGFLNTGTYTAIYGAIYDYSSQDDIVLDDTRFINPYFDNLTEIENGYPDGVFISRGDYSENQALYFHLLKITNTIPDGNQSTYYYDSKVFKLTKDSKYYKIYDADTDNDYSYYYVQRSSLTLDTNSSYLYVLSNSGDSISNSYGILQPDNSLGIYDVVESDTAGVITEQQALNDKISNINNNQQEIANNSSNINNYLNENTISNDTNQNIDTNLNFNNQNSDLNNLNTGFFSRLTTMLSNISNYDLAEDTSLSIPLPNSNQSLVLHSKDIYDNVTGTLRIIINSFWVYIFSFYMWKFINKIYIAVSTGNILETFSSSGEAITNDML